MNAKMGWLVKPSGLVELQGLLDGQVEGADQNGVKDGGHGDDGQHGGGELAYHAEHGHLDDHEDDAGDKGGQEGCDNGDGGLDLTVLAGGVDDAGHEHGGDALGGKINERRSGGDLDHGSRDKANDERLADVGANDQDGEAEGRDDELGADHAARDARDGLADGEVEDEAGGEQDGEQDEGADIEFAAVGGLDGAGLGGGGVLRHGENPFGMGVQEKSGGA